MVLTDFDLSACFACVLPFGIEIFLDVKFSKICEGDLQFEYQPKAAFFIFQN